jgi:mannose-6-phosphate isomerase-like protein (cupin superfamily)
MIVRKGSLEPVDFNGLSIFDYTADSNLSSSLATIDVPPGACHPQAWSKRSDKYYLVAEGRLQFVVAGETANLEKGDFCYVKQGDSFSYTNVSPDTAILVLVHTPPFDLSGEVFVD